jgi:two-component system heavy metal sensor histidine kinase CusS
MSSTPAKPRSIASQLVLLFTLAAALVLCCGLGVLYLIVIRHAFEEDNAVLADKLTSLRSDLDNAPDPRALHEELKLARGGQRVSYLVRVLDAAGNVVAESPGMGESLPREKFPRPQQLDGRLTDVQHLRLGGKLFALVSATEEAGGQLYTVQVAQDRSVDDDFTKDFGLVFVGVLLCGVLASAVIAISVTKRGLRPLVEITQSLRRTGPTHLNERVAPVGWPRELQPLAIAFDEMLDRLEDSFTRLSQFSADLAHELRTPVANLRGEAEVALTRPRSPEEYREVIESSVAECERLSGIIDSLLFLARAESAREPVELTTFDARAAVEKIATYYETVAEEQHVTLRCEGAGTVRADALLFSRAVSNLLDNALRYTPRGGEISITVAQLNDTTSIVVRDSGSGISSEHLPRVFDRFYRVDSSRSSRGTGLGLALVKSIMDLHGGDAEARSRPGNGTAVTLTFPTLTNAL